MAFSIKDVMPLAHHAQKNVCLARPRYRQGRRDTAVKVYTINQESKYLLVIGVPAVGAKDELENLCNNFGEVINLYPLDEYPCEEFTETYLVCYGRLQSARIAKRKLDGRSFLGGVLHVCYAPEFETPDETRLKLIERQKYVSISTHSGFIGPWNTRSTFPQNCSNSLLENASSSSAVDFTNTASSLDSTDGSSGSTYIWAGKTYSLNQPINAQQVNAEGDDTTAEQSRESQTRTYTTTCFVPRQLLPSKRKCESVQLPKQPHDATYNCSVESPQYIKDRLSKVNVPNLDVCFKRKRQS